MKAREYILAAALAAATLVIPSVSALAGSDTATGANSQIANTAPSGTAAASSDAQSASQGSVKDDKTYQLGAGDKVRLSVFGESDLGGEFEIDGSGDVRLPLIGQVK